MLRFPGDLGDLSCGMFHGGNIVLSLKVQLSGCTYNFFSGTIYHPFGENARLFRFPQKGGGSPSPCEGTKAPHAARPNFSLRPEGALLSSPRGRAPSPPFSFCRKKRTGRWSGPREKTPGAPRLNVLHEARKGPWTPSLLGECALSERSGGVGGAFYASGGAVAS